MFNRVFSAGFIAFSAAALAACSSGLSPTASNYVPSSPVAAAPSSAFSSLAGATSNGRIFISAGRSIRSFYNEVDIYDAAPPYAQTGALTDQILSPNGLAVDSKQNLYVSSIGNAHILKFAPRATKPSTVYRAELSNPLTLTVDSNDNLWAVNYKPIGQGSTVLEYPAGSTQPARRLFLPGGFEGLAVTADGTLFAGYNNNSGGTVLEYSPNSNIPIHTGIHVGFAGCVAFDHKGRMLVCDQTAPAIDVYSPGSTQPESIISTSMTDPYQIAFSADYSRLFVADNASDTVNVYSYPAGSLLTQIVRTNTAYGVALIPGHP